MGVRFLLDESKLSKMFAGPVLLVQHREKPVTQCTGKPWHRMLVSRLRAMG